VAGSESDAPVGTARDVIIDEAVKERAMDEAPVGITISDPTLPDNPLVYVNDAYERLTGYGREDVVGRNCRLLQGPDTREEPVAEMARAVASEEPTTVELRNYRKDGTEFWNRVDIAPVHEDGELTHFVGFQTDVTRRVLAEQAARERARELRDERTALARVLDRVNGLVTDVTEGVVAASSRADLQRAVCRAVAGVDAFAFAWVGEYDHAADAVVPEVGSVGGDTEVSGFELSFSGGDPVTRAVEEGSVVVATADGGGLHGGEWPDRYAAVAAVPLAYRAAVYGVLCVYATDAEAFDDTEREVLGAIGLGVETAGFMVLDLTAKVGFGIVLLRSHSILDDAAVPQTARAPADA
jgi:PAS domain S-box-containing protein